MVLSRWQYKQLEIEFGVVVVTNGLVEWDLPYRRQAWET
jgi:hypothetical protein